MPTASLWHLPSTLAATMQDESLSRQPGLLLT
jgi:hypothetical protein